MSKSNLQKTQSPYTPTTEEVRNIFSWNNDEAEVDAKIGFDNWLSEVKAEAWEEGYAHGTADALTEQRLDRDNPYQN